MPIYRAEATLHDVDVVGGAYDGSFFTHSVGEVMFAAREPVSLRRWGLLYRWAWENLDPFGPGFWVVHSFFEPLDSASVLVPQYGLGLIIDPDTSASYGLSDTDTEQQTYKAGGTIAIEKDSDGETLTFITPVGSIVVPFADVNFPVIDPEEPILAAQMGHGFVRTGGDAEFETARWTDFRSLVDGDEFHGHALTTADPGTWGAWTDVSPGTSPIGSQAGPRQETDDQQLVNGYQTSFTYDTADGTRDFYSRERRTLADTQGGGGLDMARAKEHAVLWQAAVMPFKTYRLRWRRSHIHGAVWEAGTIYEEIGKVMEWPSISYQAGVLLVFWAFDGVCYSSHSEDAGETWSAKMTLDYSGDYPRHIMHPDHPFLLYFFFDGSTIKVARSTDSGKTWIDAAPVTVDTGITPQQLDAEFSNDGSILVSYFEAGVWTQMRSRDAGLTWEA